MRLDQINVAIGEIKSLGGNGISNIVYSKLSRHQEYETISIEGAIAILVPEAYRTTAFFVASGEEQLCRLLQKLPQGVYIETFHKMRWDGVGKLLKKAGFSCYASYVRETVTYIKNPYEFPIGERELLLGKFYDQNMGEVPKIEDAEAIFSLCMQTFDPVIDDVFSVEEWRNVIRNRECLMIRSNTKIVTLYKWRVEGKKLYSNVLINLGPANLAYNLQRKVFDSCWREGIRTIYSWINVDNKKSLERRLDNNLEIISGRNYLYQSIYTNGNTA